jgi:hypothetical protein
MCSCCFLKKPNQEELDNYWYAYGFIDYPLGFLIMDAEDNDFEAAERLNLWREFFGKNPEKLEEDIQYWKDGNQGFNEASAFFHCPLNILLENGTDERLIIWRGFFKKHPEEFVKESRGKFPSQTPGLSAAFKRVVYDEIG